MPGCSAHEGATGKGGTGANESTAESTKHGVNIIRLDDDIPTLLNSSVISTLWLFF